MNKIELKDKNILELVVLCFALVFKNFRLYLPLFIVFILNFVVVGIIDMLNLPDNVCAALLFFFFPLSVFCHFALLIIFIVLTFKLINGENGIAQFCSLQEDVYEIVLIVLSQN